MKHVKRLVVGLLALAMLLGGGLLNCSVTASAASVSYPKKVRISVGYGAADVITVKLADEGDTIKVIKPSNKNIIAYQTSHIAGGGSSESEKQNQAGIGVYAKKKGTHTVKFGIYGKDGKKKSTKSVKVYAYDEAAIKSFKVDGKEWRGGYCNKKKAKIKVTMAKGYKLKKIEIGTYKHVKNDNGTNSEMTYKKVKNGSTITFGTKPYYYSYKYSSEYGGYYRNEWNKGMTADTQISITYIDKYTKSEETVVYYISKLLNK